MKKLITIILILFAVSTQAQNVFKNSLVIQNKTLTGAKITAYDAAVIEINDTVNIIDAIRAMPFMMPPPQTAAVISTLTSLTEPTLIYDLTNHVWVLWNGTEWREITTTKSTHY